ncbi:MAG: hypothetical protein PHH49_00830 [Candidatus Omnitrophica bacterium]|nr:hypothetical protein [Candidatus Omnitrophota bacterium]MDD5487496.1 hypothetical protein [Candidatus Omnitrophota bacterium]
MKRAVILLILILCLSVVSYAEQPEIRFDFEKGTDEWGIPDWAMGQEDMVGKSSGVSSAEASTGEHSLELVSDFPGNTWAASLVELDREIDLVGYKTISFDVFLPSDVKNDLMQARIVVTAGPWFYIEMREPVRLKKGKWTTVSARLDPGARKELAEWKCNTNEECLGEHLNSVKKITLRIEYDANNSQAGSPYDGPVYIDNIVIK